MASNFDNAARFYDLLAGIVFGKSLRRAQIYLLQFIPSNSAVLIAGGGTGWILKELNQIHPSGLNITYVEISAKMLALSRQHQSKANNIIFIHSDIENAELFKQFDVVITPFLFDNFTEATFQKAFASIHKHLKAKGIWLCADFQLKGKFWQKALLKCMYIFFRAVCRIETTTLPRIDTAFANYGYIETPSKAFYGNFIKASVYRQSQN